MIEFRQLVQFLEIAKQNSFRTAAKELNLSQPALSRSIQRLEELLGVKLFDRGSKKITLTAFGEALRPRAASIVNSVNDTNQLIDEMRGIKIGEFKVGFGPVYADLMAARSIGHFSKMYPKVKIRTLIGRFIELIDALNNGQIDIFIGETSVLTPRNKYWVVPLKKRIGVYCCRDNHPIFQSKSINHNLVTSYPLISCQLPIRLLPLIREPSEGIRTEKQVFFYSDIVCDSYTISKQIAKNSNAICLIPKILITSELEHGELRILHFKHKELSTNSGIVCLAEREPSPAIEKYIKVVKELDEQLSEGI